MFKNIYVTIAVYFILGVCNSQASVRCYSQNTLPIEQRLACIPGLRVQEITSETSPQGTRQFDLQFEQKIDHFSKSSGTFWQRLVLTHRDEKEPMVLQTSGYSIFGIRESVITRMFQTNQLQVEHRFFSNSVPSPVDWSKLDIEQSANDFHRITVAFKAVYPGPWVNTGGSKGGMTSVFHRRFFPDDLIGTVADVAPLSFGISDDRYISFVDQVGGNKYQGCREDLSALQAELLQKRDQILPGIQGQFKTLGSAEVAFEHAVIELPFVFWQYGTPESPEEGCPAIPINATATEQLSFLNLHSPVDGYDDLQLLPFQPYFVQAATQLGGPASALGHLALLLKFPIELTQYLPKNISFSYDSRAMIEIRDWVAQAASRMIFVYGEFDPWTAGAYPDGSKGRGVYHFIQPMGNHSSKFVTLEQSDRTRVTQLLAGWLQKAPVISELRIRSTPKKSLENLEFETRRRLRLM